MGIFMSILLEIIGFAIGSSIGLIIGFYFFIYSKPDDVQDPVPETLYYDCDAARLQRIRPEIPSWVKKQDYERIDWVNKIIFHMWPYLDKSICSMIRGKTKPLFDVLNQKLKIISIDFEKLTLGSLPPIIHGLKVWETKDKELTMEPAIYWAGNPNIVVGLTILSVQIKLQLVDIQISAAPRVTLKPIVPIFPCFGKVVVSLMEKIRIDFGLKILGGDVMAIPGLHDYVQETIEIAMSQLYIWPNFLEIPMLDASLKCFYLIAEMKPVGMLHVKVVKAMNLSKMDWLGLADPYVKLSLSAVSGDSLPSEETTIKKKTLNPEWNENFKLIVKDPLSQLLNINVYDWDKGMSHDRLGMQVYPLKYLEVNEAKVVELDLLKTTCTIGTPNEKERGQIVLELTYSPFKEDIDTLSNHLNCFTEKDQEIRGDYFTDRPHGAGLLSVSVSAEDVEGVHHTNPYVVIFFEDEERKSKCIRRSHNPQWNQEFQFKLDEPPQYGIIHIKVMSKSMGKSFWPKESLGYVSIYLDGVFYNERINQKYHLFDSKKGILHVEFEWKLTRTCAWQSLTPK